MEAEDLPKIEFSWKRPPAIPYPNIWCRFETRTKNGKSYKCRIEDLREDRFDEAMEFMMSYYFTEEPLSVLSKLLEDEVSLMIYRYLLSNVMEQRVSILAVLDEDVPKPKIVGLQLLTVASKSDPDLPEVPGEAIGKFRKVFYDIQMNRDPFAAIGTDRFLQDWGLCVSPELRGLNIGFNILTSLQYIAEAFNISSSMILFTRIESQVIADRAGFQLYSEIVYQEYKDENGHVIFPVVGTKSLKLMKKMYT